MIKSFVLPLAVALCTSLFFSCTTIEPQSDSISNSSSVIVSSSNVAIVPSSSSSLSLNNFVVSSCDINGYRTVEIDGRVWMAENLNCNVSGSKCGDDDNESLSDANTVTCDTYGRLYDWVTAMWVCPSGWHLPSKVEWNALTTYVQSHKGCTSCDAKHLKAKSGWNGLDSYGFSALPGGDGRSRGDFGGVDTYGVWWSASDNGAGSAYNLNMYSSNEHASWDLSSKNYFFFSVRCVQD